MYCQTLTDYAIYFDYCDILSYETCVELRLFIKLSLLAVINMTYDVMKLVISRYILIIERKANCDILYQKFSSYALYRN